MESDVAFLRMCMVNYQKEQRLENLSVFFPSVNLGFGR